MDQKKTNTLITDYFKPIIKSETEPKIIKGYNPKNDHYHCLECGADMGKYQGQLCRKSYCDNQQY